MVANELSNDSPDRFLPSSPNRMTSLFLHSVSSVAKALDPSAKNAMTSRTNDQCREELQSPRLN